MNFYNNHHNQFEFTVITKGTQLNIEKKKKYLDSVFGNNYKYYGMVLVKDEFDNAVRNYDKTSVDMSGGIQIDDRADCLRDTNASVKILIQNGDRYWNNPTLCANAPNNLYIVHNWNEVVEILLFIYNNKYLLDT